MIERRKKKEKEERNKKKGFDFAQKYKQAL